MLDFGLQGKTAIVCASSKGLGLGCARALSQVGVNLVMCARGEEQLGASADQIRKDTGVEVKTVVCDITSEAGRAEVLAAAGHVDILVNNAGGPPPGDFRDWSRDDWIKALDANMLTAIELIKAVIDPMIDNKFGRIVNITSGSVKSPIPQLGLSNGARSGLTGFVGGLARQVARHLLPCDVRPRVEREPPLVLIPGLRLEQGVVYASAVHSRGRPRLEPVRLEPQVA